MEMSSSLVPDLRKIGNYHINEPEILSAIEALNTKFKANSYFHLIKNIYSRPLKIGITFGTRHKLVKCIFMTRL